MKKIVLFPNDKKIIERKRKGIHWFSDLRKEPCN
jgi:hypothetical protein